MLKIPKQIQIGGLTMQVVEDKSLAASENRFGECDHMRGCIIIDANQPQDHKEVTLIHEIIEKLNLEHELKLEHNQITSLASSFHQIIKDNFSQSQNIVVNTDVCIKSDLIASEIAEYFQSKLAVALKNMPYSSDNQENNDASMECKCGGTYKYLDTIYRTKYGSIVGLDDLFKCNKCGKKITLKD